MACLNIASGAKHVMVAPPSDFPYTYLHPIVHPSHRQSQIHNMTHPDLTRFPLAERMGVLETVLRPGETIYIPPYWLHSVHSITTTIAVSIWTESPEGRLWDTLCTSSDTLCLYFLVETSDWVLPY